MWTGDYEFESRNGTCDTTLDIHNTLPKAKKKKRYLEIEDISQISQCKWPGNWSGGKWRPKTIVTQMYYILPRELYLEIISKYVPCTVCQQHVCQQLLFYPWGFLEGLKSKLLLTNSFDPTGLLPRGRFLLSDVRYNPNLEHCFPWLRCIFIINFLHDLNEPKLKLPNDISAKWDMTKCLTSLMSKPNLLACKCADLVLPYYWG